jgi:hypothetical protein
MNKILIILAFIFFVVLFSAPVKAEPPESITIDNNTLLFNGSGYRSKFFIKVYRGSLYLPEKIMAESQSIGKEDVIFKNGYPGAIKMQFVYNEVEAEKIKDAFREGIENNSPMLADTDYVKKFINIFDFDVVGGDVITLFIKDKDSVTIFYNENILDAVNGKDIGTAVYKIYIGEKPADGSLKKGMLGK